MTSHRQIGPPRPSTHASARSRQALLVLFVALLASTSAVTSRGSRAPAPTTLALRDVNVVSMVGDRTLPRQTILVREGVIVEIGPSDGVDVPGGARVVDADGGYVVPGLIDCHVHLRDKSDLGLYLTHGVTTVRNMHGSPRYLRWRDAIRDGLMQGPRIVTASPITTSEVDSYQRTVGSAEAARDVVREYAASGYDWIKAYDLQPDALGALVAEARRSGLPVGGHFPWRLEHWDVAARAGFRSLEHLDELEEVLREEESRPDPTAAIDLLRASRVAVVTILLRPHARNLMLEQGSGFLAGERGRRIADLLNARELAAARTRVAEIEDLSMSERLGQRTDLAPVFALLRLMIERGVVVALGTDSGSYRAIPGLATHEELKVLVDGGLTPLQALRSATLDAARLLGLDDMLGTVEVGRSADLVLTREDPLEDLSRLREPVGIVRAGLWLDDGLLTRMRRSW